MGVDGFPFALPEWMGQKESKLFACYQNGLPRKLVQELRRELFKDDSLKLQAT